MNEEGKCLECPWFHTCNGKDYRANVPDAIVKAAEATSFMDLSKWDIPSVTDIQSNVHEVLKPMDILGTPTMWSRYPSLVSSNGLMASIYATLNPKSKP